MFHKLDEVEKKYHDLTHRLSNPELIANTTEFQKTAKEQASLREVVETYQTYKKIKKEFEDNKQMISEESDESLKQLAKDENVELEKQIADLENQLKIHLLPKDPNDDKNTYLEIRAGTGGEEAGLFAADLLRMYTRFAENNKWQVEMISSNATGIGGFKEVILLISGDRVYSQLKYESGIHRVQRVPKTETSGRVHTSAVTVAVMPEVEDVEVDIAEKDLRFDVFRAGGHGGQSVNTTDSAVRVTHMPSGLVVICQDEKSQHKNKAKALKVLRARLYDRMLAEQQDAVSAERKEQVGSGDRSEKIRTYNFPQGRLTDHRINLTLYQLDAVLTGDLKSVLEPLHAYYQAEALKSSSA